MDKITWRDSYFLIGGVLVGYASALIVTGKLGDMLDKRKGMAKMSDKSKSYVYDPSQFGYNPYRDTVTGEIKEPSNTGIVPPKSEIWAGTPKVVNPTM